MAKNEFKGFDDWIQIFKGGKQVDSSGAEHDGDALIDKAVASFNASEHEPPVVVGHPKDNAPAFGWVEGLKAEHLPNVGKVLLAKFKEVVPEFEALLKAGRYKKRSAAFYPDGRLRHVGFLGAMPPAVKGLADLKFEAGEQYIEFSEGWNMGVIGRMFGRLREWLIEKDGVEVADRIMPDWDIDHLKQEASRTEKQAVSAVYNEKPNTTEGTMPEGKQFSEADVKAAEEAAAAKAKEEGKREAQREFAEAERKRGIDEFIARNWPKEGKGKLPPALLDAGVKQFMEQLDGGAELEFSEGKKQSPLAWFMTFMESLPASGLFTEVATRDKDMGGLPAGEQIAALVAEKRKSAPTLSYAAAFSEVQAEHPDLAKAYQVDLGK
ncbi:MAG: peptidase [Desulfobulbus sp.]|nr:MAG: peptidase [Desulfobulbus sp.]